MKLAAPNLDDRTYQDLVDEALRRIPAYIDGWTAVTPSDPGVTLLELFAWLTEIVLYRQNQMPDWLTIKMMQLFGMRLDEPKAATTEVTFQLADVQAYPIEIPAGTEVATTQTETQPSIIFSTDRTLVINEAILTHLLKFSQGNDKNDEAISTLDIRRMKTAVQSIFLFSQKPNPNDALYLGFENDMSLHLLHIFFGCDAQYGTDGIDTARPPYVWEGATLDENGQVRWQTAVLETDETRGLLFSGRMMVHLPDLHQVRIPEAPEPAYWIRLRVLHSNEYPDKQTREFTQSPRINQIALRSVGGTVPATHAECVKNVFLGYSNGAPDQRFTLPDAPILRPDPSLGETLTVRIPDPHDPQKTKSETWVWVAAFGQHDIAQAATLYEHDKTQREAFTNGRIFTLDTATGELRLPPAQTTAEGHVRRYGQIPPRQSALWFNQYRHGGGVIGNVGLFALDTLKTAIPQVNRIYNRQPATGGKDQEPLESAKLRAPALLHAQNRAVTAADFEYLATQANVAVGRVKCLQHKPGIVESVDPGVVYLFVLPHVDQPARPLSPGKLTISPKARQQIATFLDDRRLLTTRLQVDPPVLVWVQVTLSCRAAPGADKKAIADQVGDRLYQFINPLIGGREKTGWPFGRDVTTYDVYAALQGIEGVLAFPDISLAQQIGSKQQPAASGLISVPQHGVVALAGFDLQFGR